MKVNYLLAYVGELLTFSERSYKTICAKVKEIVKLYQNKICLTEYESNTLFIQVKSARRSSRKICTDC